MTPRRELQLAVGSCLSGAALVLWAVTRVWVTVAQTGGLTIAEVRTSVTGAQLVPAAQALGYVGLAGVLALAATRRWGRVLVGVLVLTAGAGVVLLVADALADDLGARALTEALTGHGACGPRSAGGVQTCVGVGRLGRPSVSVVWAWLTAAGGLLLVVSGALVAWRGRGWSSLSRAYDAPTPPGSAQVGDAAPTDRGVWDALDRGDDPTT